MASFPCVDRLAMLHLVSIHIIMVEKSKRDFIKIVKMAMVIKKVLEEEEDHPICVVALFSVTSALRLV